MELREKIYLRKRREKVERKEGKVDLIEISLGKIESSERHFIVKIFIVLPNDCLLNLKNLIIVCFIVKYWEIRIKMMILMQSLRFGKMEIFVELCCYF